MNRRKIYNWAFAALAVVAIAGSYYYSQTTGKRVAAENSENFIVRNNLGKFTLLKEFSEELFQEVNVTNEEDLNTFIESMQIKWEHLLYAKEFGDSAAVIDANNLERSLKNYQEIYFPFIRKMYVIFLNNNLNAQGHGATLANNSEIIFWGKTFHKKEAIKSAFEELHLKLEKYRFKGCAFQVSKNASENFFYSLNSLKDRDVIY